MSRLARVVCPNMPHHIVHRGNRREPIFFGDADRKLYLSLLAEACPRYGLEVWSWCLMANHVHLLLSPRDFVGLAKVMQWVARNYSFKINRRNAWTGRLWEVRYFSCIVERDSYLWAASAYIETNPVRAGLVSKPERWEWSSARAHLFGEEDKYLKLKPWLTKEEMVEYKSFIYERLKQEDISKIRKATSRGRPLATKNFIVGLEKSLGRSLRPRKRGRKVRLKGGQ